MASEGKFLTASELSAFCSQIAMILRAGVPVQEGIAIMSEDDSNTGGEGILKSVREACERGETFYAALAAAGVFPKYMLDMVNIGEQSGRLDEVMASLADYYDRNEAISRSIKSAVTYPILMIIMMLIVIGILVIKVLPIFSDVFAQLGAQMSGISLGILQFGTLLNRYSVWIVGIFAVIIVALLIMANTSGGRRSFTGMFHKFFLTRRLAAKIDAGHFASAMSMMLQSGLDVDQSLAMSHELVVDSAIRQKIVDCQKQISDEGVSFSDALSNARIFTGVYTRMVSVGFKTGSVDEVMKRIADHYEQEVDDQIGNMISILEPSLVAILSLIVGMILLSVMLPLMGVMTSIG